MSGLLRRLRDATDPLGREERRRADARTAGLLPASVDPVTPVIAEEPAAGTPAPMVSELRPRRARPVPAPRRREPQAVVARPTVPAVRVALPSGKVAEYDWEALLPTDLVPVYAALDREAAAAEALGLTGGGEEHRDLLGDEAGRLLAAISPSYAGEEKAWYELDDRVYTTLAVRKWPVGTDRREAGPEIWEELINGLARDGGGSTTLESFTLSLHHHRIGVTAALKDLRRDRNRLAAQIAELSKDIANEAEVRTKERQKADLEEQIQAVSRREQTQFHVSCYLRVGAASLDELRAFVARMHEAARRMHGTELMELPAEQRNAFVSSMPYADDMANATRLRATHRTAQLFPLITRVHQERGGVLYGLSAANYTPVLLTPFPAYGSQVEQTTVLGQKGSGKTFWMRTHLGRLAMTGRQLLVIDPLGDFVRFFGNNAGQVVSIYPGSPSHINPFRREWDASINDFEPAERKIDRMRPMFQLLLGGLMDEIGGAVISTALTAFYRRYGTEEHLMRDFIEVLKEQDATSAGTFAEDSLRRRDLIRDRLAAKCLDGELADLFAHPTNVEVQSKRLLFNLLPAGDGEIFVYAAFMAMTLAMQIAMRSVAEKVLVVDEIHRLYSAMRAATGIEDMLKNLVRTHRHWRTALTFATQFTDDDDTNKAQASILKGSSNWVLLGAQTKVIDEMIRLVGDSTANAELMHSWLTVTGDDARHTDYKKAIVIWRGMSIPIYSVAFGFEKSEDDKASGVFREGDGAPGEPRRELGPGAG